VCAIENGNAESQSKCKFQIENQSILIGCFELKDENVNI